jgi:type II secretory pathway predicted ATPase ExeA
MTTTSFAEKEQVILSELKDFQRATVERCFTLFKGGQRRVLVADEVGLGKTLIAKGVIAKLANHHHQAGDDLFKVLYICSNGAIANQNIRKLKICDNVTVDDVFDTRLSMQHLKICEQENDPQVREGYVQLIPLTPATSFNMTGGEGNAPERALIYAILEHLPVFQDCLRGLRSFLMQMATKSFDWCVSEMQRRVKLCNERSDGKYLCDLLAELDSHLDSELIHEIKNGELQSISSLRALFAQISIKRLEADLVIMDEFQRFRELIAAKPNSETGMLATAFLKGSTANTLLLSATPYKLYQTLEEAAEDEQDEHYREFLEVMNFLFDDERKSLQFKETWSNFSMSLREANSNFGTLINIKKAAENEMYGGVCRTERLLVQSADGFTLDRGVKSSLTISENDILSFLEAERLTETEHIPVEYIKSCPYVLSFMERYKYKTVVKKLKPIISRRGQKMLFVNERKMRSFDALPPNNARLELLENVAFENNAERLLWVPPSIPYYEPRGAFKGKTDFSKILVFSAWEMVPRMIACMLSYECERRTIGKLYVAEAIKRNKGYFVDDTDKRVRRFPLPRLTDGRNRALVIANDLLAGFYNGVQSMGSTLRQIKESIRPKVIANFDALQAVYELPTRGGKKAPVEIYVNMAIASPAICAFRVFGDIELAEKFAKEVANMFDKPEAIAAVELCYGKRSDDAHYRNVLQYCVDGNFAAVLDEYAHMLGDRNPHSLCEQMCDALKTTTASYQLDTYSSFASGEKKEQIRMRSHFSVGFYQTGTESKTVQRKENLRTAFNSPFRPFVLATTSIGQEGLDFHNYARKIMHWNLPHNPIDLEQREGRINRYKCLAVRRSLAAKYKDRKFSKRVWDEVFAYALADKRECDPELVPFWCLPDGGNVKIERITPMYPYSRDKAIYDRLLKILSLYRVTLGQARQEELLEYLFNNIDEKLLPELFINLSPISREPRKQSEGIQS